MTALAPHRSVARRTFDQYLRVQLKDPEFRRAWEARMVVAEVAMAVRRMRDEAGLTQAQLAALIGVQQPMIARVERGSDPRTPRWDVLRRVGLALGKQLVLDFVSSRRAVPLVQVDGLAVRKPGSPTSSRSSKA